jgi:hypothetical protein
MQSITAFNLLSEDADLEDAVLRLIRIEIKDTLSGVASMD